MPLRWERGKNPYVWGYFQMLGVSPDSDDRQIAAISTRLTKRAEFGKPPEVAGIPLTTHQISQAANGILHDPDTRLAESLLVHPAVPKTTVAADSAEAEIRNLVPVPGTREPMPMAHPLAFVTVLPHPSCEAAAWPDFDDFGFVGPQDEPDQALDIVFDS